MMVELFNKGVTIQLISADQSDPATGRGKLGKVAIFEKWNKKFQVSAEDVEFDINFEWDESLGFLVLLSLETTTTVSSTSRHSHWMMFLDMVNSILSAILGFILCIVTNIIVSSLLTR